MNIRIVTASAGTGKTTHLAEILDQAVRDGAARPEAILATTFTRQAAAELVNRARTRLLQSGRGPEARALLTARIGTVNSICGALVTDFSFELGLSPELRVLDEAGAELTLKRALATAVTDEVSDRLQAFRGKFDSNFDWHYEVRRIIEAARANGIDADRLAASAERSVASLDACLGKVAEDGVDPDAALGSAIDECLEAIRSGVDATKGTQSYCDLLQGCRRDLDRDRLRWGDWAKLCTSKPTKKSLAHAGPVQAAAARHLGHPRLREDLHELIRQVFDAAARGLRAYQQLKQQQGLLDFVDQEVYSLDLLSRSDIQEALRDEIDLLLVDEFQDTSPLQLAIFLQLAALARESVWVGDPKQAIYGFRGTDPALMDAAIESLSSPSRDPDLVEAAVAAVQQRAPVKTLSRSYRSRPALVHLTNALFTWAFQEQQQMPADRVATEPHREESAELGHCVSHWPLSSNERMKAERLAEAAATGVRDLLTSKPTVRDQNESRLRPARAGDVAVLCRTNKQCLAVSEALGQLGIASMVARVGLRESAEAQVLLAGLRLWVDPRDRLAAATLQRILEHPAAPSAFVEELFAATANTKVESGPAGNALLAAREDAPDLDVLDAVDAVVEALDLRRLCAAWGEPVQRVANLDALRAHAATYGDERKAAGDAPSLVGFLAYFDELADHASKGTWGKMPRDTMARVGSEDAVTVSTWHAAKGLEWPIVTLFGLESVREPVAYGVHVLSDRPRFDLTDPLGGRWIHFWPNPYTTSNQKGPIKEAYQDSNAHRHVTRQSQREALRVLYVGWTRARDQLILAAQENKLTAGILGTLASIEKSLIEDPGVTTKAVVETTWAKHTFPLHIAPAQPTTKEPAPPTPGNLRVGRPQQERPPATLAPSSAPPRPAQLQEPVRLGGPLRMRQTVDTTALGNAVHAFLAVDRVEQAPQERLALATDLLERYQVAEALAPADLLQITQRLWRWLKEEFGNTRIVRTEWPLGQRLASGTHVLGTSDLVVEAQDVLAVIDHKSFGVETARAKAPELAGQMGCYADVMAQALPGKRVVMWVHLPLEGVVAEVRGAGDV